VVEVAEYGRSVLTTVMLVVLWPKSCQPALICGLVFLVLLSLLALPVVRTMASATPGWCTFDPRLMFLAVVAHVVIEVVVVD
jgi:hypothetical protein